MRLRQSAAGGFAILFVLKALGVTAARASAIVLALLLAPDDFGIFAIAMFFVGVLVLFADLGLGTELVRRSSEPRNVLETAFTIRLALSVAILLLAPFLGIVAASLYSDPRLELLVPIATLPVVFYTLSFPSRTLALHRLKFGPASIPDQAGKVAASVLAIAFALLGWHFWSFAYAAIGGALLAFVLFQVAVPWRPALRYDSAVAKDLVHNSKYILLTSVAGLTAGSVDVAYLGLLAGPAITGIYVVATSWALYLTASLSSVLSGVTYPIFAKIQNMKEKLSRGLLEIVRYYAFAAAYSSMGVFILAEPFVLSILGPIWSSAIVPMRILSLAGFLAGLTAIIFDALTAVGSPRPVSLAILTQCVFLGVLLAPAIAYEGLLGVSVVVTAATGVSLALALISASRTFGVNAKTILGKVAVPAAAAVATSPIVLLTYILIGTGLLKFALLVIVYSATYIGMLNLASRGTAIPEALRMVRLALTSQVYNTPATTDGRPGVTKVLLLSPFTKPVSGVWTFVRTLAERMRGGAFEIRFVPITADDAPHRMRNLVLALRSSREVWRARRRVDLVHCQQLHLQSLLASVVARVLGKRVVLTVHGRPPRTDGLGGVWFDIVEVLSLKVPNEVVYVADSLRRILGPGRVIPNGVPVDELQQHPIRRETLRRDLGIEGSFVLLFSGRITADKGFLLLMDAVLRAQVRTSVPLKVLAVGPVADDVLKEISRRGDQIRGSLCLIGPREKPWENFAAADVVVLPSFREGLPFGLLEAMAAGLPAIATAVGDVPEVVRKGSTGWLVNPGDTPGLENAILEAFNAGERRLEFGREAASLVAHCYNISSTVAAYKEVYARLTRRETRSTA